ncbi:hypothetical protein BV210_01290 [Halorientalis sp. IM1011]|nr:hypothetical protein BV210_01290 [Halorientalis sp. IM1011]
MLDQIDDPERATLLRGLWQAYRLGRRVARTYRVFLSLVERLLSTFAVAVIALVEASMDIFAGANTTSSA